MPLSVGLYYSTRMYFLFVKLIIFKNRFLSSRELGPGSLSCEQSNWPPDLSASAIQPWQIPLHSIRDLDENHSPLQTHGKAH